MDTSNRLFPACPSCGGEGRPTTVTASDRKRMVTYACQSCGQTWTITSDDPDMIFPVRKD